MWHTDVSMGARARAMLHDRKRNNKKKLVRGAGKLALNLQQPASSYGTRRLGSHVWARRLLPPHHYQSKAFRKVLRAGHRGVWLRQAVRLAGSRRGRHLSACDTRALERLALLVVAVCVAVDATYRYAVSVTVLWQLGKGARLTGYDQAVERESNTNTWIPISGAWRS